MIECRSLDWGQCLAEKANFFEMDVTAVAYDDSRVLLNVSARFAS